MIEILKLLGGILVIAGIIAGWVIIDGTKSYAAGLPVGLGGVVSGLTLIFMGVVIERLANIEVLLGRIAKMQSEPKEQKEGRPA